MAVGPTQVSVDTLYIKDGDFEFAAGGASSYGVKAKKSGPSSTQQTLEIYAPRSVRVKNPKTGQEHTYSFSHWIFPGTPSPIAPGIVDNKPGQQTSGFFSETIGGGSFGIMYTTGGGGGGVPSVNITATVMPDNSGLVQIDGAQASMTQTAIVTYGNPVSLDTAKIPYSVSGRDFRFLKWVSTDGNESYDPKFSYVPMRDAVWIAMYVEIYHEGLILYDKNKNPSQVLYDSSNDKIMRDIRTGEIEV